MKKVILAVFLLGTFTTAFAQQQVKFGPKAGVNFANLSGYDNSEMKIGFHVGAVAEIKFNEKFSIQPEVVYSSQGTKENSFELNNDYINIPILAKYYIIDGFSVEAGPQIGFLAKSETKFIGNLVNGVWDTKDLYKSTDFGLNLGLAYDLPSGLFVNARYNLGLSRANEEYSVEVSSQNGFLSTKDLKNNVIQIGIGYKFD